MEGKLFAFIAVGVLVGAAIGGGIGFAAFGNKTTDDETYYFYIDFGDSDQKSGWYSAKAANADDALIKAVDGKDITLTWSGGYPAFGEGFWAVYNYTWDTFTKKAADNSVGYPQSNAYGLIKSNGWDSYAGFDETCEENEHKLCQSASTVFYFSSYNDLRSPVDNTAWKAASGTPFATE